MANDENRNGFAAFCAEITATWERTAAWAFRGLIIVMLTIIGWLVVDKIGTIDMARLTLNAAVDRVTASQIQSATAIRALEITVQDYIKNQDYIIKQLDREETDHEQRLRHLERPQR